jgi:hypothetical protein
MNTRIIETTRDARVPLPRAPESGPTVPVTRVINEEEGDGKPVPPASSKADQNG